MLNVALQAHVVTACAALGTAVKAATADQATADLLAAGAALGAVLVVVLGAIQAEFAFLAEISPGLAGAALRAVVIVAAAAANGAVRTAGAEPIVIAPGPAVLALLAVLIVGGFLC